MVGFGKFLCSHALAATDTLYSLSLLFLFSAFQIQPKVWVLLDLFPEGLAISIIRVNRTVASGPCLTDH